MNLSGMQLFHFIIMSGLLFCKTITTQCHFLPWKFAASSQLGRNFKGRIMELPSHSTFLVISWTPNRGLASPLPCWTTSTRETSSISSRSNKCVVALRTADKIRASTPPSDKMKLLFVSLVTLVFAQNSLAVKAPKRPNNSYLALSYSCYSDLDWVEWASHNKLWKGETLQTSPQIYTSDYPSCCLWYRK